MSNGQIKTKKGDVYDLDDLVFSYYTPLGKLETKLDINSLRCLVTESQKEQLQLQAVAKQIKEDKKEENDFPELAIGSIISYSTDERGFEEPKGFLLCNGQQVKRKEYPQLYEVLKDRFGQNDEEYFRVPDLRGKFIRGIH